MKPLDYADPAHWICRPGHSDVCSRDLSATVVGADGSLTVQPLKANPSGNQGVHAVYLCVDANDLAY